MQKMMREMIVIKEAISWLLMAVGCSKYIALLV